MLDYKHQKTLSWFPNLYLSTELAPWLASLVKKKSWYPEDGVDSVNNNLFNEQRYCTMQGMLKSFLERTMAFECCYGVRSYCLLFWQAIEKFEMSLGNFCLFLNLDAKKEMFIWTHTFPCRPRQMCGTPGPSAGLVRWEHLPSACLQRCCLWIKTSRIECSVYSVPTAKDQQWDAQSGAEGHHLQQEQQLPERGFLWLVSDSEANAPCNSCSIFWWAFRNAF